MSRLALLLLAATTFFAPGLKAQDTASDEVMAAIQRLFDAMRAADGDDVRAAFTDNARLQSAFVRDSASVLHDGSIDGFATSVGKASAGDLDEQIWGVDIRVDGPLATAWVPYAFFHKDSFSHCGVNAMMMFRAEEGWKILQLTDTRRRNDCKLPDHLQSRL